MKYVVLILLLTGCKVVTKHPAPGVWLLTQERNRCAKPEKAEQDTIVELEDERYVATLITKCQEEGHSSVIIKTKYAFGSESFLSVEEGEL